MSFPKGDTPEQVRQFYLYLNGHQETTHPVQSWHVDWMSLAWLWGFVIVLTLVLLLWVRQYRTTRQRGGIYPVDSFGGWTTEAARPVTGFFLLLTAIIVGFAVALIVGHIVYGQKF
jgi:multisubunit Na+/H+ antiporter MnhC subunit